jgi:hypothetical protein
MAPQPDDKKDDEKDLQVTPDDLKNFAGKIRELLPLVTDAKGAMDLVNIVPGNFADATNFKNLVGFGTGGRAGAYSKHLGELKLALTRFADGLDDMVRNYTTTEALNKDLADKIQELVNEVEPILPANPAA